MSSAADIVRDLLIFVGAMFAMLIVLIVIISRLPNDNPPKMMLTALSYRFGATVAAGALAIPIGWTLPPRDQACGESDPRLYI